MRRMIALIGAVGLSLGLTSTEGVSQPAGVTDPTQAVAGGLRQAFGPPVLAPFTNPTGLSEDEHQAARAAMAEHVHRALVSKAPHGQP